MTRTGTSRRAQFRGKDAKECMAPEGYPGASPAAHSAFE